MEFIEFGIGYVVGYLFCYIVLLKARREVNDAWEEFYWRRVTGVIRKDD